MATYHLDFTTDNPAPGYITSVKVVISKATTRDKKASFSIALLDDPLYAALHRYCMDNPPPRKPAERA